jgi:hypothetical protein
MATKDKEIKQRNERKNGRRNTEDIDAKEDIEEDMRGNGQSNVSKEAGSCDGGPRARAARAMR